MKDFSITRIPNNDLIGMLFYPLISLSEYEIEVIKPEYIDDFHVTSNGAVSSNTNCAYSVTDVSKYDYIILPLNTTFQGAYDISGMNDSGIGSSIATKGIQMRLGSGYENGTAYAIFKVDSNYKYAIINTSKSFYPPIIAFRRHRTDNVNPKLPMRPELEPIEVKERAESEPEPDAPEEVEEE